MDDDASCPSRGSFSDKGVQKTLKGTSSEALSAEVWSNVIEVDKQNDTLHGKVALLEEQIRILHSVSYHHVKLLGEVRARAERAEALAVERFSFLGLPEC